MELGRFKRFINLALITLLLAACSGKVQSTATPEIMSTPTSPSSPMPDSPMENQSDPNCVKIAYPQPRNAFRAWMALGKPDELTFHNNAGPDGDGSATPVTRETLPELVHVDDEFCAP